MDEMLFYGIAALLLLVVILHGCFILLDKIENYVKSFFKRPKW